MSEATISLRRYRAALAGAALLALLPAPTAADDYARVRYREPPAPISRAFDRASTPLAEVDPRRRFALVAHARPMPSIDQLAADAGGQRRRQLRYRTLQLVDLRRGAAIALHPAPPARLGYPRWAPDGRRFLFAAEDREGVAMWIGTPSGALRRLAVPGLETARGGACGWMPDGERLVCVLGARAAAGRADRGRGPRVLDTAAGLRAPGPQPRDGAPRASAQLALVDVVSSRVVPLGAPGPIARARPSPDGRYLLVSTHADGAREARLEIRSARPGARVVASAPGAARRLARWQDTDPATLVWVDSPGGPHADGGDRVLSLRAPFDTPPVERFRAAARITDLRWTESSGHLLVTEYRAQAGERRTWLLSPHASRAPRLLWADRVDSAYDDPGLPIMVSAGSGAPAAEHDGGIFVAGHGATSAGARPFLDRVDLATGRAERLWRSDPDRHERVEALASADARVILVSAESPRRPRGLETVSLADGARIAITRASERAPIPAFTTQIVRYQRADGVRLSATLHLPAGHAPGQRLPLVMEAYPRTYADRASTGEVRVALNRYPALRTLSALPLAMRGYAVLRNVAMPVIGAAGAANDSFVEQVSSNARAAVAAVVDRGVADPRRVGVLGHSYGAFMVATLLAHTDLFRAGVAASGAYNRTLTPLGFQTERRTLWEAEQAYLRMSPLLAADRINEPLLLVHGARDENPGTPPQQSRELFRAVHANGGTARLVLLPYEGHVYRARESVLHATAEMIEWFDRHLRPPPQGDEPEEVQLAGGRSGG